MVLEDDLRRRWIRSARAAGREVEAAALEADVSAAGDMSAFGDMSLSAARATQAIEQLHERDADDDQPHPWRS